MSEGWGGDITSDNNHGDEGPRSDLHDEDSDLTGAVADAVSSSEVNAGHLKAFIERIERLEEEKSALAQDIKEVYGEAKANGFDTKIMHKIVSIRKQDRDSRLEEETILDLYLAALGMN